LAQAVATVLRRGEIQRSAVIIDDDTVDIPRRGTADQSVPYITQYEVGVPTERIAPTATRGRRSGDAERTDLHVAVLRGLESLAVVGIHHHLALGAVATALRTVARWRGQTFAPEGVLRRAGNLGLIVDPRPAAKCAGPGGIAAQLDLADDHGVDMLEPFDVGQREPPRAK